MANNNKMNIIEALIQLRDDLKLWVANNLRTKVDKEDGKGLSSNDFTTEDKTKLNEVDNKLSLTGGTMSGNIDMGNKTVINITTPTNDNDAATKKYVDGSLTNCQQTIYTMLPKGRMKGDVDGDGHITARDATLILNTLLGYTIVDEISLWCADTNSDGNVTGRDATEILQYLTGDETSALFTEQNNYYSSDENNWIFDTNKKEFHYDISITGLNENSNISIIIQETSLIKDNYSVEVLENTLRIWAKLIPIKESPITINYFLSGEGIITITFPENETPVVPNRVSGIFSSEGTQAVDILLFEQNNEYDFTSLSQAKIRISIPVDCHGFITFANDAVSSPITYETPSADGVQIVTDGDDISTAIGGETWEFSAYGHNGKEYIIWKNWSA